jgi:hypothetical protein
LIISGGMVALDRLGRDGRAGVSASCRRRLRRKGLKMRSVSLIISAGMTALA